jgi:hypothetical protein
VLHRQRMLGRRLLRGSGWRRGRWWRCRLRGIRQCLRQRPHGNVCGWRVRNLWRHRERLLRQQPLHLREHSVRCGECNLRRLRRSRASVLWRWRLWRRHLLDRQCLPNRGHRRWRRWCFRVRGVRRRRSTVLWRGSRGHPDLLVRVDLYGGRRWWRRRGRDLPVGQARPRQLAHPMRPQRTMGSRGTCARSPTRTTKHSGVYRMAFACTKALSHAGQSTRQCATRVPGTYRSAVTCATARKGSCGSGLDRTATE